MNKENHSGEEKISRRKELKAKIESFKKQAKKNSSPKVGKLVKKTSLVTPMSLPKAKKLWFSPRTKGRPSKRRSQELATAKKVLGNAGVPLKKNPSKVPAKRGRPKKSVKLVKADPKRPRGRPRKHPIIAVDKPKRPRGRPRKHPVVADKPKRPRGRPRKYPLTAQVKRPRGRPKKLSPGANDSQKRTE